MILPFSEAYVLAKQSGRPYGFIGLLPEIVADTRRIIKLHASIRCCLFIDDGSISHYSLQEAWLEECVMEMGLREAVATELKYSSEVSVEGQMKTQEPLRCDGVLAEI
jgi:hypothetical protein